MKKRPFKKIIIIVFFILLSLIFYFYFKPENKIEYVTEKAIITDLEQIVSVNGTVESNAKIRLRFQKSGKVEKINFNIGDKVKKGDELASIDSKIFQIQIEQANANLSASQADLNLRKAGPSNEEIRISETQIEQALVNLNNSKRKYEDSLLINNERLRKAELELENAKVALSNAENLLKTSDASNQNSIEIATKNLKASYIDSEPAIILSVDAIDRAITSADQIIGIENKTANEDYRDRLGTSHPSANIDAINSYSISTREFSDLKDEHEILKKLKANNETEEQINQETDILLSLTEKALYQTKDLLDKTYFLLDMTPTGFSFPLSRQEELKSRIANEKSSISTNLQNIQKIIQRITSAKLDLSRAIISESSGTNDALTNFEKAKNNLLILESNLKSVEVQNKIDENNAKMQIDLNEVLLKQANASHALLVATPRSVDLASLYARISSTNASLKQIQKEIEDTYIYAPLEGIITEINSKVGENVSTAENVIVMMTDKMQVKANISETDINKIQEGNEVEISFDSLMENLVFKAVVSSVSPAETIVDGVIYYEITVMMEEEDKRIKSGMTADMEILTAEKESVVAIPSLAVEYENRQPYCFILENNNKVKRYIKLGIEGQDFVEVIEGILEGEEIILYEK